MKGGDDPRQDAIMEQAFNLINDLLNRDERTRSRRLRIRTYKVVPLSTAAGMIQFVEQTRTLGDVLTEAYKTYVTSLFRASSMTESSCKSQVRSQNDHETL